MRNLSDPKYRSLTDTTAEVTVTTDTDHGNMRWTVDPQGNIPTEQQVFDGENAEGSPAVASGNFDVTSSGVQPWQAVSGLSAGVEYAVWFSQAGLFYSQQPVLIEASVTEITVKATGVALGLGTDFIDHFYGIWPQNYNPTDAEVEAGTGAIYHNIENNLLTGTEAGTTFGGGTANTRYELHWLIKHPTGGQRRGDEVEFYFANTPPSGKPYITPDEFIAVGDVLTCNTGTISDPDGLGPFTYQWYANGRAIKDATEVTYIPTPDDVGRYITVGVSYVDGSGEFTGPLMSDPVGPIIAGNVEAEGQPVVEGTVEIGEILTANTVGITDANGIPPGDPFTYQWQHFDNADIIGATSKTYEVQPSDEGKQIRVFVTFTDSDGYDEGPLYSEYTVAVPGVNFPAEGQPVITGTVLEGETLTADTSGITDANGIPPGDPYSYQWQSGGAFGTRGIILMSGDIPGATDKTYVPTLADTGSPIRVYVTFTDNDGYDEGPLYSDWTINVPQYNRAAEGKPSITGSPTKGSTLTAGQGTITDVNGVPSIDQFTWQWKRSGTPIAGATSITHILGDADVGETITVEASFTDLAGFPEGPLESDPTSVISDENIPAEGNPVVTGVHQVGMTLTCTVGTITDGNGFDEANFQYKWYRNTSILIDGATSKTYVIQSGDVGNTLHATVEFTDNAGYPEGPLPSNQVGPVEEDLTFFHNFDTNTLGGFSHSRASDTTTEDYKGVEITVPTDVPAYTGARFNGVDWFDENVGYGILVEGEDLPTARTRLDGIFQTLAGVLNDFCFQVTCRFVKSLADQPDWVYFFSLSDGTDDDQIQIFKNSDTSIGFQTRRGGVTTNALVTGLTINEGDIIDFRCKKSSTTGLTGWVNQVDTANEPSDTADMSVLLDHVDVGKSPGGGSGSFTQVQMIRISPAPIPDQDILNWETWIEPLPIITQEPSDIDFGGAPPVGATYLNELYYPEFVYPDANKKQIAIGGTATCMYEVESDGDVEYEWTHNFDEEQVTINGRYFTVRNVRLEQNELTVSCTATSGELSVTNSKLAMLFVSDPAEIPHLSTPQKYRGHLELKDANFFQLYTSRVRPDPPETTIGSAGYFTHGNPGDSVLEGSTLIWKDDLEPGDYVANIMSHNSYGSNTMTSKLRVFEDRLQTTTGKPSINIISTPTTPEKYPLWDGHMEYQGECFFNDAPASAEPTMEYAGQTVAIDPTAPDSLYVGHRKARDYVSIWTVKPGQDAIQTNVGMYIPRDWSQHDIIGAVEHDGRLYTTQNNWYDNEPGLTPESFTWSEADLSATAAPTYWELGSTPSLNYRHKSHYLGRIPEEWQALFEAPCFCGGGAQSIISTCNNGFSFFTFNPADIETPGWSALAKLSSNPFDTPLMEANMKNPIFQIGRQDPAGAFFIPGTRTWAVLSRSALGTSYYKRNGEGGYISKPTEDTLHCYDALDLLEVKAGRMLPKDVQPYQIYRLDSSVYDVYPKSGFSRSGATVHPVTGRMYAYTQGSSGQGGRRMHIWDLK